MGAAESYRKTAKKPFLAPQAGVPDEPVLGSVGLEARAQLLPEAHFLAAGTQRSEARDPFSQLP